MPVTFVLTNKSDYLSMKYWNIPEIKNEGSKCFHYPNETYLSSWFPSFRNSFTRQQIRRYCWRLTVIWISDILWSDIANNNGSQSVVSDSETRYTSTENAILEIPSLPDQLTLMNMWWFSELKDMWIEKTLNSLNISLTPVKRNSFPRC